MTTMQEVLEKLTDEQWQGIAAWLLFNKKQGKKICPFGWVASDRRYDCTAICPSLFPKLPKARQYYHWCPCGVFSYNYVRRCAKYFLKFRPKTEAPCRQKLAAPKRKPVRIRKSKSSCVTAISTEK